MLNLDGGQYSGSGTIVRFGVALAALTGQELTLTNIRARRDQPGLRPQHLKAVEAITGLCQGTLEGGVVGSRELHFRPGPLPQGGDFHWDIGTAGSTTMLALALLPVAAFATQPCSFRLTGGVFQDFAPSAFHFQNALLPLLRRMGLKADLRILRPGYAPAGGGVIELTVEPVTNQFGSLGLLQQDDNLSFWGVALSSHLGQRQVSHRMAASCQEVLAQRGLKANIQVVSDDTASQAGAALAVFAQNGDTIIGADQAGALRRSAESIGQYVGNSLLEDLDSGAAVDRHLADQLVIFAALGEGTSEFLIPGATDHVQANIWLVEAILGVRARLAGQLLRIQGTGYERRS
jgi:RNA 3'-terminal phosphate cyclase (ATP)